TSAPGNVLKNVTPELSEPRNCSITQIQRRGTSAIFIKRFINPNEPLGMRKRQWPQEHAFHDGENCSVRTDTDCKGQNGSERDPRRFAKLAKSEFQIIHIIPFAAPRADRRVWPGAQAARKPGKSQQKEARLRQGKCSDRHL